MLVVTAACRVKGLGSRVKGIGSKVLGPGLGRRAPEGFTIDFPLALDVSNLTLQSHIWKKQHIQWFSMYFNWFALIFIEIPSDPIICSNVPYLGETNYSMILIVFSLHIQCNCSLPSQRGGMRALRIWMNQMSRGADRQPQVQICVILLWHDPVGAP